MFHVEHFSVKQQGNLKGKLKKLTKLRFTIDI